MNITLGRIVVYHPTEKQKLLMKGHVNCNAANYLPAIIVAVLGDNIVNLTVFLDGDGTLWVTSSHKGDEEGEWHWPNIEVEPPLKKG